MIVHNFDSVLVDLGFFEIRWYSLAYILGIVIGWLYASKIIKITSKNEYSFEANKPFSTNLVISRKNFLYFSIYF